MKTGSDSNFEDNSTDNVLPTAYIQDLVDNYRANQLLCIKENLSLNDAHSIWFNLKVLKEFIAEIESEAALADPEVTDKDLGIRFYYGAYPENSQLPLLQKYAKRHTLVMIPTKKEKGLDRDFNPYEKDLALAITLEKPEIALGKNHGHLVPPGSSIGESY